MPSLRPLPNACAILTDYSMGKDGGNCTRPATVRAVWRFDMPGPRLIQLCDQHAAEFAGHERGSHSVRHLLVITAAISAWEIVRRAEAGVTCSRACRFTGALAWKKGASELCLANEEASVQFPTDSKGTQS